MRRLVTRPRRLRFSAEAVLILLWIATLMVSDLVADAARFQLHPQDAERGGAYVAAALATALAGLSPGSAAVLHHAAFWLHVVLVLGFLNYLPYGKHFHVLTALPAVFLGKLEPYPHVQKMDFEAMAAAGKESFGVGKVEEYSWRRVLDLYTCTECGRCNEGCPTHVTNKPLHPRELIVDERDHVYAIAGTAVGAGTTARRRQDGGVQGARGGDRAARAHRRRDQRGHALGLHHLRLLHGALPGADRAHRPHRRPAPQPDDDAGEDAPRAAGRDARPRDQQQPLERQRPGARGLVRRACRCPSCARRGRPSTCSSSAAPAASTRATRRCRRPWSPA